MTTNNDNLKPALDMINDVLHNYFDDPEAINEAMHKVTKIVGEYGLAEIADVKEILNTAFDEVYPEKIMPEVTEPEAAPEAEKDTTEEENNG